MHKDEITPHTFVTDYEFRSDGGDYTPTESERAMIEDAICGYLAVIEADDRISDDLSALLEEKPVRAIPLADNCGRYLAEVNDGTLLYLNHANQWQECPNFIRDALAVARMTKSEPAGEDVKPITLDVLQSYFEAMNAGDVPDQALALYSYLLMDGFIDKEAAKADIRAALSRKPSNT